MIWFKRPSRPAAPALPQVTELNRMSGEDRAAVLAGAEGGRWIESAAHYGFVEAQLLAGQRLLAGGEAESALGWFRAAAAAGYVPAINMVGRCLERGWGTAIDLVEAAGYYRRAAEQGFDWAQFNLANLLLYGLGVAPDRRQARMWYEQAAGQGHAKSMNMLGRFEDEGWTGSRDSVEAAAWYFRAAQGGDYRGQFNYGTVLAAEGRLEEARSMFERALAGGDADFHAEACALLQSSDEPSLRALGLPQASGVPPSSCSGAGALLSRI